MTNQNNALKMAITQMVELGREYRRAMCSEYSIINQCKDRDEKRKLEKFYYNEIAATANVIRLFTGREISFQWQGTRESLYTGFALYEILEDVPCDKIPCGVSDTTYSRFTGRQEKDRRIDWGKGMEQGKIIKIFEYIFDVNANPSHFEKYLVSEFEPA
jgi:hypothetical protein